MEKSKQTIRQEILAIRAGMSNEECEQRSQDICDKLLASEFYKKANVIYAYMAFRNEVNLSKFIRQAFLDHKHIAIPRVSGNIMTFYYPRQASNESMITRQGYFGIEEPEKDAVLANKADLILLPGVAFDKNCNRIGYGKGFYDTYIKENVDTFVTVTIGIAYECQLVDVIPVSPDDYRPHYLLTEKALYSI